MFAPSLHRAVKAATVFLALLPLAWAQPNGNSELDSRLAAFVAANDLAAKEKILLSITNQFGETAGQPLLNAAIRAADADTRWMAIRGIGYVKFKSAAPRLIEWLKSPEHYVRANAARALGEIHDDAAVPPLIELLKNETDDGVIQQTALALGMLKAIPALPTLEQKINSPSLQTRMWIIDAVDVIGARPELPFFAQCLNDEDVNVAARAARAIERITGQDFGFPKANLHGLSEVESGVKRARSWWQQNQGR